MTQNITRFTVTDPRTLDGDPFEVAGMSIAQAKGLLALLRESLLAARVMARNAEMERQLLATGTCDAAAFEETAQASQLDAIVALLNDSERKLTALEAAASYNPRARIPKEA